LFPNGVLIANRGEIACRVMRTCRRLGVPTIAVYSSADGPHALHVQAADYAVQIGTGPTPADSYLRQHELLEICHQTGAQAVHPGYGFLSENATFCQAALTAGVKFVGPGPAAIQAMGSKSHSKKIMEQAGVPTTPGYYGDDCQDAAFLKQQAVETVGFPLLIKAVMGGGGKGMRVVHQERDFDEALESCRRESLTAFGDDVVILEKYLINPRHVEVQVVADSHGNVVHLYERDCSLQRRHQKIIEEAPASDLDPVLRAQLGEMGKRAALAAGYENAGTVEFLLDTQEPGKFYFCEMNTRLQVEHPVSEMITGIDLVEWQLRIAAGEELPILNQADIPCRGHAFEARVYAENPARNFMPATGNVWHHVAAAPVELNAGASSNGVRVDTGIQPGQDISVYYDPMISKLIVHDENREKALDKLVKALKGYQIAGVPTNIDFLIKCADHATFRTPGAVNTGFLDAHAYDVQVQETDFPPPMAQAVGAFASLLYLENRVGVLPQGRQAIMQSPWSSLSGSWRMGGQSGRARRLLQLEKGAHVECISNRDGSFEIRPAGPDDKEEDWIHVAGFVDSFANMQVVINKMHRITLKSVLKAHDGVLRVRMWPDRLDDYSWSVDFKNPLEPASSEAVLVAGEGFVKAPMPGKISRINAVVGDTVKAGQVVMVMEAMKMEHVIKAPRDGTLAEIRYVANDIVDDGAILLVLESESVEESTAA
jgi:3-methylcrotonyl-CoA carboxylase alpha subunit